MAKFFLVTTLPCLPASQLSNLTAFQSKIRNLQSEIRNREDLLYETSPGWNSEPQNIEVWFRFAQSFLK